MSKLKVAFICVHNSCRSQISEAIGKILASDIFDSYSAGTELKSQINSNAISAMKIRYSIDMSKTQFPKLLHSLPKIDIVITMGCNVICPSIPCTYQEDWGIDDPSNKNLEEFFKTIQTIEEKILNLKEKIINNEF